MTGAAEAKPLERFSVIVPARNEEEHLGETLRALAQCLEKHDVPYELVPVDDGSTDGTWALLEELSATIPNLRPVRNDGPTDTAPPSSAASNTPRATPSP